MTTFVMRNGQLVEKHNAPPRSGVSVMSDINPFLTQDGKEIGSRSALRAYEQANGVKQVGNDHAAQMREMRHKFLGDR
jgi:hypothetical protein